MNRNGFWELGMVAVGGRIDDSFRWGIDWAVSSLAHALITIEPMFDWAAGVHFSPGVGRSSCGIFDAGDGSVWFQEQVLLGLRMTVKKWCAVLGL